jgi:hypothetical protein
LDLDLAHHLPLEEELLDTFLQREDHSYRLLDGLVPFLQLMY